MGSQWLCVSTIVAASMTELLFSQTANEEPFIETRGSYTLRWFAWCTNLDENAESCVIGSGQNGSIFIIICQPHIFWDLVGITEILCELSDLRRKEMTLGKKMTWKMSPCSRPPLPSDSERTLQETSSALPLLGRLPRESRSPAWRRPGTNRRRG